jgi:hypothetical protein
MNRPTGIEAEVCADIAARQQKGIAKYGVTVDDNQLTEREWLQHHYEELLDAAIYCKKRMKLMDEREPADYDAALHARP